MHILNAVQNQANTYTGKWHVGTSSWVSNKFEGNQGSNSPFQKWVGNTQISTLSIYQEQETRKYKNKIMPGYKSQLDIWNESCCQLTEDADRVGLCNSQYMKRLKKSSSQK